MGLFYKPDDGWCGDFIPFYWKGEYHLFYLKDCRNKEKYGEGVEWFHIGTRNFVDFTDYGKAVPRGKPDERDLYVFTGCVFENNGLFYIFYTGHNSYLKEKGEPEEVILRATSRDLLHWEKDKSFAIESDTSIYELHDWRDPFVFWNESAKEFWMLVAARVNNGPIDRRGCTGLCVSKDLNNWEVRQPFWAPWLYYNHECPDLFEIGKWQYLVVSNLSEKFQTHYRLCKQAPKNKFQISKRGCWTAPAEIGFDDRNYYAAKTAGDGKRRFIFGWNPTFAQDKDDGVWQWGGNLVVHEIIQRKDGMLKVKIPKEIDKAFGKPHISPSVKMGNWKIEKKEISADSASGFSWCKIGEMPKTCKLSAKISFGTDTRCAGFILRADEELNTYYQARIEPQRQLVSFTVGQKLGLERHVGIKRGKPVDLKIFIDGSVVEIYVNDEVALSTRIYADRKFNVAGVFVAEGKAVFRDAGISEIAR